MNDKENHPGYVNNPRKKEVVDVIHPTAEEWEEYQKACAALEFLRKSPYYDEGGPEYKSEVSEPQDKLMYRFTETWEEYRERFSREESKTDSDAS